jgi:hypothetical protein
MSRLRGNLPGYLQQCFGICRRTFQRWCARGDVPGAYRTRGGHWRVRKASKAMIKSFFLRPRAKTRRDQVGRAIIDYPFNPSNFYLSARDIEREKAAVKLMLAAYGISEDDFFDLNLKERDPEKYYILWEKSPPALHPRVLEAVNDPQRAPAIAATIIRVSGRKVTTTSLARALQVSVDTLYRRYGQPAVRMACEEPVTSLPPSEAHSLVASARSQTMPPRHAHRQARDNSS